MEKGKKMIASTYDIEVILYAYKSRVAIQKIKQLIENASGNNRIIVRFIDQYQLDRKENFFETLKEFEGFHKFFYHHVFWDYIQSPFELQEARIKSSIANYILLIDDRVNLVKNWDSTLSNFVQDKNIIVSGNGAPELKQLNDFYVTRTTKPYNDFLLTQYVVDNFIFANKHTFFNIENNGYILPTYLKCAGFEEIFSLQSFEKGVDIFSCPSNLYTQDLVNGFKDYDAYVPFSRVHNYNQVIKLFSSGFNDYIRVDKYIIDSFIEFHNFDFKNLAPLPYEKNDVNYATQDSIFDKMDGRRFLDGVKSIN